MQADQEHILDPAEALSAICLDLRRYEPLSMMCAEILRIVLNDPSAVSRDPARSGLWVRTNSQANMRYLEGAELVDFICACLGSADLSLQDLAGLCRRVFQTAVQIKPSGSRGGMRLHIATGMEGFRCRLCGHCCRKLDYRGELNPQDVARWTAEERHDILKWVGITKGQDQEPSYRIWVIPDTNQYAPVCPFLKRGSANDQWICAIQETKPDICRHYPSTRKHAISTACRGFDDSGE